MTGYLNTPDGLADLRPQQGGAADDGRLSSLGDVFDHAVARLGIAEGHLYDMSVDEDGEDEYRQAQAIDLAWRHALAVLATAGDLVIAARSLTAAAEVLVEIAGVTSEVAVATGAVRT